MGTNNLTVREDMTGAEVLEKVIVGGDLSKLSSVERLAYYKQTCDSLGLNALTRPFEYIVLNGKLTLYARKDCTEQLRTLKGVSVQILSAELVEGVYVVKAKATMPSYAGVENRFDESIGAVNIEGLKGDAKANAMMKAETKAKRRVTLSICGLGMLDETEAEIIPNAVFTDEAGERHSKMPPLQVDDAFFGKPEQIVEKPQEGMATEEQKSEIRELAKKIYGDKNGGLKIADYIKKYKISNGNPMTARHAELIIADLEKENTEQSSKDEKVVMPYQISDEQR